MLGIYIFLILGYCRKIKKQNPYVCMIIYEIGVTFKPEFKLE